MGANIGTTLTAQIISFKIDQVVPLIIFIGFLLHFLFKKRKIKNFGYVLLGLGILFFGLSVMGTPLKEMATGEGFQSMLVTFQNPLLALLAGFIFTGLIQSSTATTGIIVALYLGGVDMSFSTAAFLILGSNVGTCITAVLASIPASRESKRAAMIHVLFNVIGCMIFASLILIFPGILVWFQETFPDGARQVAMFHTFFNVLTVIILIGFIKQLIRLTYRIIPVLPDENANTKRLTFLESNVMQAPELAAKKAHDEICRMGDMASGNLKLAIEAFMEKDSDKANEVLEIEDTINYLNHQITAWLMRMRGINIPESDLRRVGMMIRVVSDVERIGDHAENIAEYAMVEEEHAAKIPKDAMEDLKNLTDKVMEITIIALDIFKTYDKTGLSQIDVLEDDVDNMAKDCVEKHIQRLKEEAYDPRGSVVFTDMVNNLERCADHATNIAYSILGGSSLEQQ